MYFIKKLVLSPLCLDGEEKMVICLLIGFYRFCFATVGHHGYHVYRVLSQFQPVLVTFLLCIGFHTVQDSNVAVTFLLFSLLCTHFGQETLACSIFQSMLKMLE